MGKYQQKNCGISHRNRTIKIRSWEKQNGFRCRYPPWGTRSIYEKIFSTTVAPLFIKYSQNEKTKGGGGMGRPSKPYTVLAGEGKSHRTKAEMKAREKNEKATLSGEPLREKEEVKRNLVAHKEFLRLKKVLTKVEKWDGIYENVINRYCLLYAECMELTNELETFHKQKYEFENLEIYYKIQDGLEKQRQTKRKMMMDIEKENIMTIASALRSIPKKEEPASNPLLEVLRGG